VHDIELLQREKKEDVSGGLTLIAYLAVGAIAASLIVLIGWALLRLEGIERPPQPPRAPSRTPVREPELV